MVNRVRAAVTRTVLTVAVAIAAVAATPAALARAAASSPPKAIANPTKAQIQSAIKRAESSKLLWATINICNSRRFPHTLGVRGQIPSLGFAAWMSLQIQVNFYSKANHRFEPSPNANATKLVRLGRAATQLEQGGQSFFPFPPHSGLLNATIEFRWRRSGKLLGETTRRTTAGHPSADFGSPPHYSAKQCLIP